MVDFSAQVPDEEPTLPLDVYPLMIDCNGFFVGGALWSRHRERFPRASMIDYLLSRWRQYVKKELFLNRFFYSEFDSRILEERKSQREQSRWERGESSSSMLREPKEEPAEDCPLDLGDRKYTFYLRPRGGEE